MRERERVTTGVGERSMTKQAFKDECDFNIIIKKYRTTGLVQHVNRQAPMYGDVTASVELLDALETTKQAQEDFAALPADVRKVAGNDPVVFLEMVNQPDGAYALQEAGLRFGVDLVDPSKVEQEKPAPKEKPVASQGGTDD